MRIKTFKIAKDFSRYPGGRYRVRGPYSGEEFREEHLIPMLNTYDKVKIDLDDVVGFPPSFIDESFGEAGKVFGAEILREKLSFECSDDPYIIGTIWKKIEKGGKEKQP